MLPARSDASTVTRQVPAFSAGSCSIHFPLAVQASTQVLDAAEEERLTKRLPVTRTP